MFGLFKKKSTDKDKRFTIELADVASKFHYVIKVVDEEFADELMSRALNIYLERNPEEAGYSASDFYLNSFVGAMGQLTIEGNMDPVASLAVFSMTDNFLRGNPKYHTPLAMDLMNNWQNLLVRMGAIKL